MSEAIISQEHSTIQHVIAVMSGKGGVGKSLITALLAIALRRQGLQVGILDGDLTGPSIVSMFGPEIQLSVTGDGSIEPLVSEEGLKIMSMSLFLENEADPTIWQGSMLASAFKQFYSEVAWGQLDYLLVDVQSGTSDVPMTILRSLPLEGIVIVSSPQVLATTVAKKTINMVHQFQVPMLGIVENMAYFMAPGGEYCEIFGSSHGSELVSLASAPLLGQLPLDPKLAVLADTGHIEEYHSQAYETLLTNWLKVLKIEQ
ncbi:MAG TPA: P-loop NTPase [Ktedonobacteraceae bacterium]|nr:P-loop NTPase [Ktedonobacteraceae bacterium]